MNDSYVSADPLRARIAIHSYGTNPTPWYAFVRALLPPADRLLDAGAGTGALWADDPPPGLVAADASEAMCAALAARRLPVVRARVERLPFAPGAFDGVLCNHVLYHLPDPAAGVAELRRVTRGWAAVATNGTGHVTEVDDVARAAGLPVDVVHDRFPAERLAAALGAHFGDVTVHRYDDALVVPEPAPVVAYVASLAGRALTPAEEDAAYAVVSERIARDGAFHVRKHTVLAVAR
ncbi:MAG TPA: methyltransferase domain-containing protein [Frankiaceae bacterium]|nr:methyltransferase domain-containing protein [Frankiaceae bacterium]